MCTPTSTTHCQSPFHIPDEDVRALNSNSAFQIVRTYLAEQTRRESFCIHHCELNPAIKETFIFHRDILHVLLLPLLQTHAQAARLAARTLRTKNPTDLELAFRGGPRGAFSWLQCFIAEESDWCATKGCPACVVLYTMVAEPTIRVLVVATKLSETLQTWFEETYKRSDHKKSNLTLPGFGFWEKTLREAVGNDEFWGEGWWEDIVGRAVQLERGIQELINQCCRPETSTRPSAGMHAKKSRKMVSGFARTQFSLIREEQEWMRKVYLACCSTLRNETEKERRKVLARTRPMTAPRTKSLTT